MDARDKILETATHLFAVHGYGATSLSKIAKQASVSKALIFWHFESKEKLFEVALQRSLEPYFINVVGDLEGLDEPSQVDKLVDLYLDFVRDNAQSVRLVLSLILRDERAPADPVVRIGELFKMYRSLVADVIESGRRSGRFRSDVEPQSEARLIMAALNGALMQKFVEGDGEAEVSAYLKGITRERLLAHGTAGLARPE